MRATEEYAIVLAEEKSLLARFHHAGVLGLADVHTALGLGRIADDRDDQVLLAIALAVRALRGGSVCLDLATVSEAVFEAGDEQAVASADLPWPDPASWVDRVAASSLVTTDPSDPGTRPLRLLGSTLYLERYWAEEEIVRQELQARRGQPVTGLDLVRLRAGLDRVFAVEEPSGSGWLAPDEPDRQRIAAAAAALGRVTVLAGGPGTGKTTTVAKILALLTDQPTPAGQPLRVALAAPTGKAAARLEEAVTQATAQLPPADAERIGTLTASTLHRLLGTIPNEPGRFRHGLDNRLPYEVIVVDEMSMVSLSMMARLLEAVRAEARLILVGDPDQLASVEAGAVMADIAYHKTIPAAAEAEADPYAELPALADDGRGLPLPDDIVNGVVRLTHTWRFGGAIGELAAAIRAGDADRTIEVLTAGHSDVEFWPIDSPTTGGESDPGTPRAQQVRPEQLTAVRERVLRSARAMIAAARAGDAVGALRAMEAHRFLCGHRTGPYGVARWTREVEHWLESETDRRHTPAGGSEMWYPGRPLLIRSNDYELGLFNGDTGVVIATDEGLRAVFARGQEWVSYAPSRLEQVQTVHAMTVHSGQGSQFTEVSLLLPPEDSPLLTRELLYTAVTRATTTVSIVGSLAAVRRAVLRPANRASGLRHRL